MAIVVKSISGNLWAADFTVRSMMGELAVNSVPMTLKTPLSKATVSLKEDWSKSILISLAASSWGEIIKSSPYFLKSTSHSFKNSELSIRAIVFLAPKDFPITEIVKLVF